MQNARIGSSLAQYSLRTFFFPSSVGTAVRGSNEGTASAVPAQAAGWVPTAMSGAGVPAVALGQCETSGCPLLPPLCRKAPGAIPTSHKGGGGISKWQNYHLHYNRY